MNWDIGIIRREEEAPARHAPPTVAATAVLAAAIAQRYTARALTASHAELAMACRPPAEINYFYEAPQIDISAALFQEPDSVPGIPKEVVHIRQASGGYGDAEATALFQRLFSRHERVSAFSAPPEPALGRGLDDPPQAAVVDRALARPVRRDASAVAETAQLAQGPMRGTEWESTSLPEQPAAGETEWGARHVFPDQPKPITLPGPEIRRVAEHVMREIDHRIVARRERLGKR